MCTGNNEKIAENSVYVPLEKLTQPAVLLLLAKNKAHGYELIQKLNQMDCIDGGLEAATVYRMLRRMEHDGLIVSKWEHGEFGPARRLYELTVDGRKSLDGWAVALKARIRQIEAFISDYNGVENQ
jgi:DNA-binding PadR family transcriptional regulator